MDKLPNPFLDRPFDPEELLAALESILQEVDLPVFICSPSAEYLQLLEIAA